MTDILSFHTDTCSYNIFKSDTHKRYTAYHDKQPYNMVSILIEFLWKNGMGNREGLHSPSQVFSNTHQIIFAIPWDSITIAFARPINADLVLNII